MRRNSSRKRRLPGAARSIIACREVRAFAIENALHWLRDYRFDGLRLDAVNSIVEPGGLSLLHDLSAAAGRLAAETGRHIHLVLENGDNRASILDAAAGSAAGQIPRAMERRLSSRLARAADRREPGLLLRLPALADVDIARSLSLRLCLSGRSIGVSRRQAWRAERPSRANGLHQFPAEPRPDRQSRARRPPRRHCGRASDRGRAGGAADSARHSHAVHGRGMGLKGAVPVLLRFRGRSRRRRAQGPPQGIGLGLCGIWRRSSRPAGSDDVEIRRCSTGTRATLPRRGSA